MLCEKPFAAEPEDVAKAFDVAEQRKLVCAEAVGLGTGVDMSFAATMRHPGGVLAQFDASLASPRRDELELIGSDGRIVVTDPWLCRGSTIELHRDGASEAVPVDPEGRHALVHDDLEVYRIELEAVSTAISDGTPLEFGRTDAINQARVLDALLRSSEKTAPVVLTTRPAPPRS